MSNSGLQELFLESVSSVTATPSVELGTERWEDGKKYMYMYNASTSTAAVKLGVVYSGLSGYSMTISSVGGEGLAGVVVNTDIDVAQYGWVCTKGHVAVNNQSSGLRAVANGNRIALGANGYFVPDADGTNAVMPIGYALAGTVAAATFTAFINVG